MTEISKLEMNFFDKVVFLGHFITKIFLYVVLTIIICFFFCMTVYFLDLIYNIKSNNYKSPLFSTYIIVSPSMVPTINIDDGIIVKRTSSLENGDIITFVTKDYRYYGFNITHRIIGIEKTENGEILYRTKGDNNLNSDDYLVHKEDINGKVLFKISKAGYIKRFLTNPSVWIIVLVISSILIIIYDVLKIIYHVMKENVKKNVHQ